jgi:hypothetical protein
VLVGRVEQIRYDNERFQAEVVFTVDGRYKFPVDTFANILTSGLLGEQYLGLEPGGEDKILAPGDVIKKTQSAVVLEKLISQFMFEQGGRGRTGAGQVIAGQRESKHRERVTMNNSEPATRSMPTRLATLGMALALTACAGPGGHPRDPLEPLNRATFPSTRRPTSTSCARWRRSMTTAPLPVKVGVGNFFGNLGDVWIGVNNLLQGKFVDGLSDGGGCW